MPMATTSTSIGVVTSSSFPLISTPSSFRFSRASVRRCWVPPSASHHMESGRSNFMDFPYLSAAHKDLMLQLVSSLETRLGPSLLPCTLPPDVQYFHNPNGSAHGSLHIRSGDSTSPVDFILGSWIHGALPSGGDLNITSLSAYLKLHTDAPNFLLELIRSNPTSAVFVLDLAPRKDLVLNPDYLKTFYEDTQLDRHRQLLEKLPEVKAYFSPALFVRALTSPTAIIVRIETKDGETERMEDIISDHLSPIAKEVLDIWLTSCACAQREVGEEDRAYLAKRDLVVKNRTIEIDLGSSFPRLFGQEAATRVLTLLKEIYNS